eukprot:TRINITY_DN1792_c0_g1_i1.p1 TRINITY_DN1792_c0_g1~~TRINITY_DN1792_c0_g1_i1.p1  ORF type:complete len:683 (-),score=77.64 TRINITY_DN1792_c0_g1_i1:47-2095(-)
MRLRLFSLLLVWQLAQILWSVDGVRYTPVLEGKFETNLSELARRNSVELPRRIVFITPILFNQTAVRQTSTACDINLDCGDSCCPGDVGKNDGTCFDTSEQTCCVSDGSVAPTLLDTGNECCTYDSSTGQMESCPPDGNTANTKCGATGCVAPCTSGSDCAGSADSCCTAPSDLFPTASRCYTSSSELCCFDGRVCPNSVCTDVTGQCCGVNLESGNYTYCGTGTFCNINAAGDVICADREYNGGTTVIFSGGVFADSSSESDGKGHDDDSNLGLILGIAIPAGLVGISILVAILIVLSRRNKKAKKQKHQQYTAQQQKTIPPSTYQLGPNYSNYPNYPSDGSNSVIPGTYQMFGAATLANHPYGSAYAAYPSQEYALMETNGVVPQQQIVYDENMRKGASNGLETAIDWSEVTMFESIGKGSFGEVSRAKWHEMYVAVKKIHEGLLQDESVLANFYSEIEILKSLKPHQNIILFCGVTHDPAAIVMEFCQNGSLYHFLHSSVDISIVQKQAILLGVARGMVHLHFYNVIHRDLAARNILLTHTWEVKVSDFGFSRILNSQSNESRTANTVGPVKWLPPEALHSYVYSTKTDVWSFGVVIWEVLTRKKPFEDKSATEVILGVCNNGLRLQTPEGCPPHLASLLDKCFSVDPQQRPTFKEICAVLEEGLGLGTAVNPVPVPAS